MNSFPKAATLCIAQCALFFPSAAADVPEVSWDAHSLIIDGRPMLYGLWRLPENASELELRILPLQPDMPVYFPAEADTTPGEEVTAVWLSGK